MSALSWGKGTLQFKKSEDGKPALAGEWTTIETPKEDTLELSSSEGKKLEAREEGGALVDVRKSVNNYQLKFTLFVKKGVKAPFEDNDGLVNGEYAFLYTPEDEENEGFQIDRAAVSVSKTFKTADGILLNYTVEPLKPKAGKIVKEYTKSKEK